MANCSICGKSCGLMGGGKEPYTSHELLVCNECGSFFKKLNQSIISVNRKEFEKYKKDLKYISGKTLPEYQNIIDEYLQNADNLFAKKAEEEGEHTDIPMEAIQRERTCPICHHLIYQGESICGFCGYSLEEFYLTTEQRKEININKQQQILKNAVYEYKVEIVSDSEILGKTNKSELEDTIMRYALNGWRLHSVTTNEIGKNAMLGINSTINNTILIFERCIKAAEH